MEMRITTRIVVVVILTIIAFLLDTATALGHAGSVLYPLIAVLNYKLPTRPLVAITSLQFICLTMGAAIPENIPLESTMALRSASAILLLLAAGTAWRRAHLRKKLHRQQHRLRELVNLVNDGILFVDPHGAIEHMNLAAQAMLGTDLGHAKRRPLDQMLRLTNEHDQQSIKIPLNSLSTQKEYSCVGLLQGKQSPHNLVVECAAIALTDTHQEPIGYAITLRDLTYTRIMAQQIAQQTANDPLTGLTNRGEFERRVQRILSIQTQDQLHMIGNLKLQGLALITETCGHEAADTLIQQISQLVQSKLRRRDTLARLGADEFGTLLEHCGQDTAQRIAHDMIQAIQSHRFTWGHQIFSLSANMGLIPLSADLGNIDNVLAAAESACQRAAQIGPNEMVGNYIKDHNLTSAWPARIHTAIASERLQLTLQPIRPLDNPQHAIAYEALLVMLDEQGNRIPAGAILPLATRLQRTPDLDSWVLRRACSWLAAQANKSIEFCALNVAAPSYDNPDYLDTLLEQLEQNDIEPKQLCFEIAEADLLRHLDRAKQFIRAVKARGCRIAIDNFGTGFASLSHLHDIQIDYVKIDGGFVRGIAKQRGNPGIVASLHQLGQLLGAKTIAHHAETDEALAELRHLGIEYAQGYVFGRPRPVKDVIPEAA
jgi:diguanylate cyclase (GGDEF)-like protein